MNAMNDGADGGELQTTTISQFRLGETYTLYLLFAGLDKKTGKNGEPFIDCHFSDRTGRIGSKAWKSTELFQACQRWSPGDVIYVTGVYNKREPFPASLDIQHFERIADHPDRYPEFDKSMLVESSRWSAESLRESLFKILNKNIDDKRFVSLIEIIFKDYWHVLNQLPAAKGMHHAMRAGWLEHIVSMTGLAASVGRHYAKYYDDLEPPLQTDILITGAVLHDIGKALELAYDGFTEASYTDQGKLVGHIVLGRDMIRSAAARLETPLDDERLLRLEHAVLAHHGIKEYGSPVEPQTLEALLLSQIDDMDAKINAVVKGLRNAQAVAAANGSGSKPAGEWTDKIGAMKPPRPFYRGKPLEKPPIPEANESAGTSTDPATET